MGWVSTRRLPGTTLRRWNTVPRSGLCTSCRCSTFRWPAHRDCSNSSSPAPASRHRRHHTMTACEGCTRCRRSTRRSGHGNLGSTRWRQPEPSPRRRFDELGGWWARWCSFPAPAGDNTEPLTQNPAEISHTAAELRGRSKPNRPCRTVADRPRSRPVARKKHNDPPRTAGRWPSTGCDQQMAQ